MERDPFKYRVGFLGLPNSNDRFQFWQEVPWDRAHLQQLKDLGFNSIQLNIAWLPRPADEPLNLEDVVELTDQQAAEYPQPVPLKCDPSPQRRQERREELQRRLALCREMGLRTIFHFGAPYNAHAQYGDGPPNCISDEKVAIRHELLVEAFARDFPGVDDLLIYTYDQDAWLCSEFGPCPRCLGVPLHRRLPSFLSRIAAAWRRHNPQGRLWWEPWELSAGQVFHCVEQLPAEGFGLALHSNIAEVQATMVADRWLKNTAGLAAARGIPVIAEYWLGGSSEELEPLLHLAHPLVTLRALKTIATVPGVVGIKEYYGLSPDREDPNLRMTGLFLADPAITEDQALRSLAEPYGSAASAIAEFWQLTSTGMELFPWDVSWFVREVGRSRTNHNLSAAFLRGFVGLTPSWYSTRAAIFMRTDNSQPHPWMLEDVQLRFELAADRWKQAIQAGQTLLSQVPQAFRESLRRNLFDLGRLQRRAVAYASHLRATNLVTIMRHQRKHGEQIPEHVLQELHSVLEADRRNHAAEIQAVAETPDLVKGQPAPDAWPEMDAVIALLETDVDKFLHTYFLETMETYARGLFSVTSR